jgi:hypothetical protein
VKVPLERDVKATAPVNGLRPYPILRSWPFARSRAGKGLVHRVRSMTVYSDRHVSIRMWCGQYRSSMRGNHVAEHTHLIEHPRLVVFCDKCEDRAIAANQAPRRLLLPAVLTRWPEIGTGS